MAGLNLAGKKILVTGAGRGIGRAIAVALAEHGSKVFALSRTPSTLDSLVKEHLSITPLIADISNWDETREKLEALETIDGLVNNAGILPEITQATEVTKRQLYSALDINLLGAINCAQVVAGKMIRDGRPGSIVNISSYAALNAYVGVLSYAVSKGALDAATRQLAAELGPHNIRVNSVNPALVSVTNMSQKLIDAHPELSEIIALDTPLKRMVYTKDVVGPVLYFISDLSSMVTATCNVIDGGLLNSTLL